jgi:hypothetical protein
MSERRPANWTQCSTPHPGECVPSFCHGRCAMKVIDELLGEPGAVNGEPADHLLELRWKLRHREDPEGALRLFCHLRLKMEGPHYLAFFRMRRWLENHLLASVRSCPACEPHWVAVKLDFYCVEAIRRVCLCAGLHPGSVLLAPRLTFAFRRVWLPTPTEPEALKG